MIQGIRKRRIPLSRMMKQRFELKKMVKLKSRVRLKRMRRRTKKRMMKGIGIRHRMRKETVAVLDSEKLPGKIEMC